MSSLMMVGPRAKYFDLQAEQNDLERLINQIYQREQFKLAGKIVGSAVSAAMALLVIYQLVCWNLDRESRITDNQIQSWRAEGYPIP